MSYFLCYSHPIPTQNLATLSTTSSSKPKPQFNPLYVIPALSFLLLPKSTLFLQRHWVDLHQEANASRYHHRLCIRTGLHAASWRSILDKRLEETATGYISPRLPAHLLYMVGKTRQHLNTRFTVCLLISDSFSSPSPPCLLYLFPARVLPQSARWLLANDRREEAIALLRKAALVNGRVLPPTVQVRLGVAILSLSLFLSVACNKTCCWLMIL